MPKRSLRQELLARRRKLSYDDWCARSLLAQQRLLALEEYRQARCIALYAPAHNETDTALLCADALAAGKRVLYPAVCGTGMVFREVTGPESFGKGCYGILEPLPAGADHRADEPDLIVVPGVAFDRCGHRIGYGKGFYDRFLNHPGRRAHLVGLCYDFQLLEVQIPVEAHDVAVEIVVTDQQVIRFAGPPAA